MAPKVSDQQSSSIIQSSKAQKSDKASDPKQPGEDLFDKIRRGGPIIHLVLHAEVRSTPSLRVTMQASARYRFHFRQSITLRQTTRRKMTYSPSSIQPCLPLADYKSTHFEKPSNPTQVPDAHLLLSHEKLPRHCSTSSVVPHQPTRHRRSTPAEHRTSKSERHRHERQGTPQLV